MRTPSFRFFLSFPLLIATAAAANFPPRNSALQDEHPFQARVAYPLSATQGRIWVKGDAAFPHVTLLDSSGKTLGSLQLSAPYYTGALEIPPGEARAVFSADLDSAGGADRRTSLSLRTVSLTDLASVQGRYSVLVYGCFQPFTATTDGLATLFEGHDGADRAFFEFFGDFAGGGREPAPRSALGAVKLLVGTGDQVYVDAGYEINPPKPGGSHPLSAWETGKSRPMPLPLVKQPGEYTNHLHQMYREFFSFRPLSSVMRMVPQVGVWDDHDIRDGWGSQGDEYVSDGRMNPDLAPYYLAARAAYMAHQIASGPRGTQRSAATEETQPLHQQFAAGRIKGFAFDLRSSRRTDPHVNRVLDDEQKNAFGDWLRETVQSGDTIMIVSSMPFFLKNNRLAGC